MTFRFASSLTGGKRQAYAPETFLKAPPGEGHQAGTT